MSSVENTPHPGGIVRQRFEAIGFSVEAAAAHLGVQWSYLSDVMTGFDGINADLATRLSRALGDTPEVWMRRQMAHDLAQVDAGTIDVERLFDRIPVAERVLPPVLSPGAPHMQHEAGLHGGRLFALDREGKLCFDLRYRIENIDGIGRCATEVASWRNAHHSSRGVGIAEAFPEMLATFDAIVSRGRQDGAEEAFWRVQMSDRRDSRKIGIITGKGLKTFPVGTDIDNWLNSLGCGLREMCRHVICASRPTVSLPYRLVPHDLTDDGLLLTEVRTTDTGLPVTLWLSCEGGNEEIPVRYSGPGPQNLPAMLDAEQEQRVRGWIEQHAQPISDHWRGTISSVDLVQALAEP